MIGWFVTNMVWASCAMLLVLVIRQPVARLLGAGPAYALWLLPALRLVAPPLPSFAPEISPTLPPLTLIVSAEAAAPLPPDGGPGQWVPLLLAIWAGGAAILLAWQYLAYRRLLRGVDRTARSLGAHRGLKLVASEAVDGPLALGLIRRRIVVPADFERRYSPAERRLALDHEAVHHRRGDLWCNHFGLLVLALNWFNPLAWLAFRAFRADQELACDAAVTAAALPEERHDYARALIKSASRPGLIAACPLNHADQLKRRLRMMKTHKASRPRLLGGVAAVTLLGGLSLALSSPGFAQPDAPAAKQDNAEPRRERHEERIIVRRIEDGGRHSARRDGEPRVLIIPRDGHAEHTDGGEHRTHVFRLRRGDGEALAMENCDGGDRAEVNEGRDNERTHVIICSRGGGTPAERAQRLERIRDRMAADSELSAEQRARVTAALERELTRLRGR
jgi:beta-lactamase regulating signal transducer with metallopeptidase domain